MELPLSLNDLSGRLERSFAEGLLKCGSHLRILDFFGWSSVLSVLLVVYKVWLVLRTWVLERFEVFKKCLGEARSCLVLVDYSDCG